MNTLLFSVLLIGADPAAPLEVERPTRELGVVRAGVPLVETFAVRNPTARSIVITSLKGGCGCLRPRISTQVILPGETAQVQFEVHTLAQPEGPNRWRLTLHYRPEGAAQDAQAHLEIVANLRREVAIEPTALVLVTTQAASREFVVTDSRARPLRLTAARVDLPGARVELLPAAQGQARGVQRLRLSVADDCPAGEHTGAITLASADPDYPELRVPVQVVKRPASDVQASPAEVSLQGMNATALIRLKAPDDREVRVEGVQVEPAAEGALQVKHLPGPGAMSTLRVTRVGGPARGEAVLRVRLQSPEGQGVQIPVRWGE